MIATITLPDKRTAVLEDDGQWTSADARLATILNELFSPLKPTGEQVSRALPSWGRDEVTRAAEFYKAEIAWPEHKPADPAMVF